MGLLMLLVLGSVGSATASAEPGPFWHHRAEKGTGEGEKIAETAKENVSGESAEAVLKGRAGGAAVTIKCTLKAKGKIWNATNQGQGEFTTAFTGCVLVGSKECVVTVEPKGTYSAHLMWKYQGQPKELENTAPQKELGQKWDILLLPPGSELTETGIKEEASFATITFVKGCGVLTGMKAEVKGATVAYGGTEIGEFAKSSTYVFLGLPAYMQHYWNGKIFVAIEPKLIFANEPATFATQIPLTAEKQEIAVFEK
jgi:hypothetical protein